MARLSLKCDHQDWLRDDKIENGEVATINFFGLSDGMFLSKNSSFIMMKLQMYTKDCRHDEPDSSNNNCAANWLGCFAPLFLSSVLVLTSKQVNIFLWVLLFYRNKSNSSLYWNAAIGKRQKSPINTSSNNQQVLQCVLTLSAYQSKGSFFGTSRPKFSVILFPSSTLTNSWNSPSIMIYWFEHWKWRYSLFLPLENKEIVI